MEDLKSAPRRKDRGQEPDAEQATIYVSESREHYEGREDYLELRERLHHRAGRPQNEATLFLEKMKEWGSGKIAVAWRRFFDSGSDVLDFKDFCVGLTGLGYRGNMAELWRQLSGGAGLRLEDVDAPHAAFLEAFGAWCAAQGGPVEVYRKMDRGANSLTKQEFLLGLKELGILADPSWPKGLGSEELLERNLYPLLVTGNCVNIDDLLFLEKDVEKRNRSRMELQRIREHGVEAGPGPLPKDGQRMLFRLSMSTTQLGGKHWKRVKSKITLGDGEMPYSPNFRPNTSWLEQIALSRLDREVQASLSLPSLRDVQRSGKRKKLKPLPPPVSVSELPVVPAWRAWKERRKRFWGSNLRRLTSRRLASLASGAVIRHQNACAWAPEPAWLQQLCSPARYPMIFLSSESQCRRRSGSWEMAHGQIVLMCGIAFAIELLDAELEEEDMSGKELQRRVHAFPSKLQGRKYFPIAAPMRVRL